MDTLLAVDVGNTNIVFGLYKEGVWVDQWRISTDSSKMPDEYGVIFRELLREYLRPGEKIRGGVISSVVPVLTDRICETLGGLTQRGPIVVGPGVKTGLKISIENPAELGSDIVCNCVAAYNRVQGNCIVVDFGTALTFTAVREPGEILGVAIAPGLQAAGEALSNHTAQLPQVWLTPPRWTIGTNTIKSIQSGVIFGYAGLVETLVRRMREEMGGEAAVIATGGRASAIASLTEVFTFTEPWLILEGLRLIARCNLS